MIETPDQSHGNEQTGGAGGKRPLLSPIIPLA